MITNVFFGVNLLYIAYWIFVVMLFRRIYTLEGEIENLQKRIDILEMENEASGKEVGRWTSTKSEKGVQKMKQKYIPTSGSGM